MLTTFQEFNYDQCFRALAHKSFNSKEHKYPRKSSDLKQNYTIRFSISKNPVNENSNTNLQKDAIVYILPKGRSEMRVYLLLFICFYFPSSNHIKLMEIERGLIQVEMKLVPFLGEQKDGGTPFRPPFTLRKSNQNFKTVIQFSIVETSNSHTLGDDKTPHRQWEKGCKVWNLPSVHLWICIGKCTKTIWEEFSTRFGKIR